MQQIKKQKKPLKIKETFVTLSEQFAKCLDLVVRQRKEEVFPTPSQPWGYVANFKNKILKVAKHQEGRTSWQQGLFTK